MENPFAIAMQWPDDVRRYLVHLQRPYFTAAIHETAAAAWLLVSWAPGAGELRRAELFQAAARFCSTQLDQENVPIEFVERKWGHHIPPYLMAQTTQKQLFIVESDHSAPLVAVHDKELGSAERKTKTSPRFDVITQWRLAEMRKYYRQFLERQKVVAPPLPVVSQ